MGVFPMVLWKNSSSIRSELTKRSEGRRRSSFPNLQTPSRTRQDREEARSGPSVAVVC